MPFDALSRLKRHTRRVGEVLAVLAKYGLADGLRWLNVAWIQDRLRSADGVRLRDQRLETRIRLALDELGTTFIKLGQVLSTRPDLVGTELADELALLQAQTMPDPPDVVRAALTAELGRPPEALFGEFEAEAFASASIAQVHRATLASGEAVVVKVIREGVIAQAETDLEILQALARLAERHAGFLRPYQPELLARQFQRMLRRELDLGYECDNLQKFARRYRRETQVHFPSVHPAYCSRRVLTMERLDGIPASDLAALRASGVDLAAFTRVGANLWLEMIFRDAVYHADPHPGNLMLLPGGVLGVLDCGMVGHIDGALRGDVEAMLLAAVENDAAELAEIVLRVGRAPAETDRAALRAEIEEFLDDYVHHSLRDLDVAGALGSLLGIIRRYRVVLPASLSLLLRTVIVLDGTSRGLDRDFSLAELIDPIYRRAMRQRLSPRRLLARLRRTGRDWDRLFEVLPGDVRHVLERMRADSFRVRLDHRHLDASVNRLTLGIVVAALILAATSLWTSAAPPRWGSVSLLGLLGYGLACLLGWRLLRAMRAAREEDDRR
ncbi:MAG: AarF/UbiB family protein [Planctomycetota bacterium]